MNISDILSPSSIIPSLDCGSKKGVFLELARLGEESLSCLVRDRVVLDGDGSGFLPRYLKRDIIFNILWSRELLGSTSLGGGIAVPHGRLVGFDGICGLFARLVSSVDFSSIDGVGVDLFFVLLVSDVESADQRRILARISRFLCNSDIILALRGADSAESLYSILTSHGD